QRYSRLLRDVSESPVAVVAIQPVLAEIGDVEVFPPVIVEIPDTHALPPSLIRHARFISDIGKRAVAVVTIERGARRLRLSAQRTERRAVNQVDIQPAVVVIINKGAARARRFD